jgi:hypothetical protein
MQSPVDMMRVVEKTATATKSAGFVQSQAQMSINFLNAMQVAAMESADEAEFVTAIRSFLRSPAAASLSTLVMPYHPTAPPS